MARAIALLGFTGSGKTAAGELLAERLGLDFVDVEDAERLGDELLPDSVLAVGSGVVLADEAWRLIRTLTRSIWLDAPVEVLSARAQRQEGGREAFEQLFEVRRRRFAEADHRIDASRPLAEVVESLRALCER